MPFKWGYKIIFAPGALSNSGGKVRFSSVFLLILVDRELDCWSGSEQSRELRTERKVRFSMWFRSRSLAFERRTERRMFVKCIKNVLQPARQIKYRLHPPSDPQGPELMHQYA